MRIVAGRIGAGFIPRAALVLALIAQSACAKEVKDPQSSEIMREFMRRYVECLSSKAGEGRPVTPEAFRSCTVQRRALVEGTAYNSMRNYSVPQARAYESAEEAVSALDAQLGAADVRPGGDEVGSKSRSATVGDSSRPPR